MGFSDCAVCQSFNVARISRTTESLGLSVRISKMKKLVTTSCGDLDSILLDVGQKLSRGQVLKDFSNIQRLVELWMWCHLHFPFFGDAIRR